MDSGLPVTPSLRKAMLPLALPVALAAGCGTPQEDPSDPTDVQVEVCNDNIDNDGDNLVDCADEQCVDVEDCIGDAVAEYAAPMPDQDPTAVEPIEDPGPTHSEYAAPFEPEPEPE